MPNSTFSVLKRLPDFSVPHAVNNTNTAAMRNSLTFILS